MKKKSRKHPSKKKKVTHSKGRGKKLQRFFSPQMRDHMSPSGTADGAR